MREEVGIKISVGLEYLNQRMGEERIVSTNSKIIKTEDENYSERKSEGKKQGARQKFLLETGRPESEERE